MTSHSESALTVSWSSVSDQAGDAGKIIGYRLFMDNGLHEDFTLVFDGEASPDQLSYTAEELVAGRPYRFYV